MIKAYSLSCEITKMATIIGVKQHKLCNDKETLSNLAYFAIRSIEYDIYSARVRRLA